jgi:hypothetical protein
LIERGGTSKLSVRPAREIEETLAVLSGGSMKKAVPE